MKNEESRTAIQERYGLLQLASTRGQNIIVQLTGEQLLFQILCFREDADVVRYIKTELPIEGTFVPGYRVALHLTGALRMGSFVGPDESLAAIKRARAGAVEWLHEQTNAWEQYIEPYADTRRLTYEGGAIDFAKGKIYKELEVVKL